jgi:hypothetical protein
MRATVVYTSSTMVLGKTVNGEKVFFRASGVAVKAKLGDILSFQPEEPKALKRGDIKYFGRNPLLVGHAENTDDCFIETEMPGLSLTFESSIKGLPSHHEKNYKHGRIVIGPRPCDLEAQRIMLSRIQTAQTSAS